MKTLSQILKSLLRITLVTAIFVAIVIGLLVAWWIAVCVVLGVSGYLAVRRMLGARSPARTTQTMHSTHTTYRARPTPEGAVIVEGEYRVEEESAVVQRIDAAVDATTTQPERRT